MARAILVAVDFSEHGRAAFEAGCALARDLDARVLLLHVSRPLPRPTAQRPAVRRGVEESEASAVEGDAEELTDAWAAKARRQGLEVEPRVVQGDPAQCILEAAAEADMVVVGTRGRSGVKRALFGSVSEKVARESPRPVMVVPA